MAIKFNNNVVPICEIHNHQITNKSYRATLELQKKKQDLYNVVTYAALPTHFFYYSEFSMIIKPGFSFHSKNKQKLTLILAKFYSCLTLLFTLFNIFFEPPANPWQRFKLALQST